MDNGQPNYLQEWGNQVACQFRSAWNEELPSERFEEVFEPSLVFHFHDQELHGLAAYRAFMARVRGHASGLDIVPELVLSHGELVLLYFRW